MKLQYIKPCTEVMRVDAEGSLLVISWDIPGDTPSTPVVDENPDQPIDDKSFAKPFNFWDNDDEDNSWE